MDSKKVKQLVIKKRWKKEKSGDEYRSFSKQVENIILHLLDVNSPINLLPLDIMTEDEVAQFILHIMDIQVSREIFNNLKQPGFKKDISQLLIDTSNKESQEMLRREFPTLGNLKIDEVIDNVKLALRIDWFEEHINMKSNIVKISKQSDAICREIVYERELAKCIGIDIHNPGYMESYIDFVEVAVSELLIFEILLNNNIYLFL